MRRLWARATHRHNSQAGAPCLLAACWCVPFLPRAVDPACAARRLQHRQHHRATPGIEDCRQAVDLDRGVPRRGVHARRGPGVERRGTGDSDASRRYGDRGGDSDANGYPGADTYRHADRDAHSAACGRPGDYANPEDDDHVQPNAHAAASDAHSDTGAHACGHGRTADSGSTLPRVLRVVPPGRRDVRRDGECGARDLLRPRQWGNRCGRAASGRHALYRSVRGMDRAAEPAYRRGRPGVLPGAFAAVRGARRLGD